ncbi:RecX family transcriptional regulator [Zobellella denitrificans]|uniref:Regulatory protein RecX n=1 Tax=Zobellella denitrificans TaxID=347534 RepID=A0A291HSM6_9GAMM|nr:regulatory protein RecX [Zobellella denitrificans]ATG75112.1 RecX family transcriptional regulator [Zobellella denitrificans]
MEQNLTPQQLWDCALRLLSRRDHGRRELARKLRQRGFEPALIEQALERLEQQHWLEEERFVAVQVRQHVLKKHGPLRIRAELQRKGIASADIERALEEAAADWFALAEHCYRARFTPAGRLDVKERARRMRYLQARGFGPEHIRHALESDPE